MVEAFAESTLAARDVDRVARFYREGFGSRLISRDDDRVWLAAGERARLGLWTPGRKVLRGESFGFTPRGGDGGGRHVLFAFSAPPGTLDRLGVRLSEHSRVRGPVEHPGGDRSTYVEDPEGNVVEVWDFFERAAGVRAGVGALG